MTGQITILSDKMSDTSDVDTDCPPPLKKRVLTVQKWIAETDKALPHASNMTLQGANFARLLHRLNPATVCVVHVRQIFSMSDEISDSSDISCDSYSEPCLRTWTMAKGIDT